MEIVKFGEIIFEGEELVFKGFVFKPSYPDEPITHAGKVKTVVRALNSTVTDGAFQPIKSSNTNPETYKRCELTYKRFPYVKGWPPSDLAKKFNMVETSFEVVSLLAASPMIEEVKREDGTVVLYLLGTRQLLGFKTQDNKYYVPGGEKPLYLLGE